MNTRFTLIWGACLILISAAGMLKAQNAPVIDPQSQSSNFLGSRMKMQDAALKSDIVFIGSIVQKGFVDPGATGVVSFGNVQVKILRVLRGVINETVISVTFDVKSGPNFGESEPQVDRTYIFFAKKNIKGSVDQFTILKILPLTADSVAEVKALKK